MPSAQTSATMEWLKTKGHNADRMRMEEEEKNAMFASVVWKIVAYWCNPSLYTICL